MLAPPSGKSGNARRAHTLHPGAGGTRFRQTGLRLQDRRRAEEARQAQNTVRELLPL